MSDRAGAATRLFAVLGDPVSHSLSPRFQNAGFDAAGLDAVYVALRCSARDLPGLLAGIARAGGGGNVTVPHKATAASTVERRTPAVEATAACNTFWERDGEVWGDNTDVVGFSRALRALLGGPAAGLRVLLIGAGGAARAVLCALEEEGAGEVVILNRSRARARELVGRFGHAGTRVEMADAPPEGPRARFDLVVNATSLGLRPTDPLPLDDALDIRLEAALDLVYTPEGTEWVRRLSSRGVVAQDGLEMLLQQGVAAFERWWGFPPSVDAMRAALPPRPSPLGA